MQMLLLAFSLFSSDVRGAFVVDRNARFVLGGVDTITTATSAVPGSTTARLTMISPRESLKTFPENASIGMTIGPGDCFKVTMKRHWLLWLWKATPKDSASAAASYFFAPARFDHHWVFSEIDTTRSWVRWIDSLRPRTDSLVHIPLITALSPTRIDSIVPAAVTTRGRVAILADAGTTLTGPVTLARGQNLMAEITPGGTTPTTLWRIYVDGAPRDSFLVGGLPVVSVHRSSRHPSVVRKSRDSNGRIRPRASCDSPRF